jgi:streptogramin lyase
VPFATRINWLAPAPRGALFVLDGDALKVLEQSGEIRTLVPALGGAPMGMWTDATGGVYVAVYRRRAVVRVTQKGSVTEVARTPAPWGPSGVVRAANGDLWILEYSSSNAARVRRVSARGKTTVY